MKILNVLIEIILIILTIIALPICLVVMVMASPIILAFFILTLIEHRNEQRRMDSKGGRSD